MLPMILRTLSAKHCFTRLIQLPKTIPIQSQMRRISKDNGVDLNSSDDDLGDTDAANYNDLYLKLNQAKTPEMTKNIDISNVHEIENYENMYLDSFKRHEIREEVKHLESRRLNTKEHFIHKKKNIITGRIYLGPLIMKKLRTSKILTEAEIAGIMAAKKTYELIPGHLSTAIHKIEAEVRADVDNDEVVVSFAVDSDQGGGVAEAMVACSTTLTTLLDFGVKVNPDNTDIHVKNISIS